MICLLPPGDCRLAHHTHPGVCTGLITVEETIHLNEGICTPRSLKGALVEKGSSMEIPKMQIQAEPRAADVLVFPVKMLWGATEMAQQTKASAAKPEG